MGNLYYKLGSAASIFHDPTLDITISGPEVLKLNSKPKAKKFRQALSGGHIVQCTEQDYNNYLASTGTQPESSDKKEKVIETKTDEFDVNQFIDKAKKAGFDEEDMATLKEAIENSDYDPGFGKKKRETIFKTIQTLFEELSGNYAE